mgnify:CR=1 FL=1
MNNDNALTRLREDLAQLQYPSGLVTLEQTIALGITNNEIYLRHFPYLNIFIDNEYLIALKDKLNQIRDDASNKSHIVEEIKRRINSLILNDIDFLIFQEFYQDTIINKEKFSTHIEVYERNLNDNRFPFLDHIYKQHVQRMLIKRKNLFNKLYPDSENGVKTNKTNKKKSIKACVCRRKNTRGGKKKRKKRRKKTRRRRRK